jgi:CheY-like chemotaxis protein
MCKPDHERLTGRRFLIIEDEIFQAGHIAQMLVELGGAVERIAVTHEQARQAAHNTTADCALLDINLGGTLSYQIAEILQFRGIPFIVCTAYADEAVDVLAAVRDAPRLAKPLEIMGLKDAVLDLLEPGSVLKSGDVDRPSGSVA